MDRNDQGRKEPTLADLEAFEQLLRESLQAPPATAAAPKPPAEPVAATEPVVMQPAATPAVAKPAESLFEADERAMAELARLIESPVDFGAPAAAPRQNSPHRSSARIEPAPLEEPVHLHGTAEASIEPGWQVQPAVTAQFSAPPLEPAPEPAFEPPPAYVPPPAAPTAFAKPAAAPLDPLAAFEEELRRFDAIRLAEQQQAATDLRPAYPAEAGSGQPYAGEYHAAPTPPLGAQPQWYPDDQAAYAAPEVPYAAPSPAEASLHAAEERLATQAAAAAAAGAGIVRNTGRSKGIFLAMGGIAVAGLAVVGGSFIFGSGGKTGKSGDVPVIAAKQEPAKEKPANPGGIEIPNQNKEVLASRTRSEVKPAQVVNTTEQPLDLNQATKRDSVRVVAPNPYQPGAPDAAKTGPGEGAAAGNAPPPVEPRRVTSVRIPVPGQAAIPAVGAPGIAGIGAIPASTPTAAQPVTAPLPPQRSVETPAAPVKVESRPVTASANQPRTETPKATPPQKVVSAPKAEPKRPANAPLSLAPPKAAAGGSGWAIQLASRPSEADARAASTRLKAQYASAIGTRAPTVVSGEANGKTVYRVRVGGYNQAGAAEACKKIKAAGGGCFVTRQ